MVAPERAADSLRKALAIGADRAVHVADDALAGSDLVATSKALAKAVEREEPDLVLFGQQGGDSDGAVLWAAVADRLRLPVISQAASLELARREGEGEAPDRVRLRRHRGAAPGRRRRLRRDQRASLPVAEGDHGREEEAAETRLPLADLGLDADEVGEAGSRTEVSPSASRPRAARASASRTTATRRRRSSSTSRRRSSSDADARLPRGPRGRAVKGSLGVLSKAAQLGGDVAAVSAARESRELASEAGRHGAAQRATSPTTPRSPRRSRSRGWTSSPGSSRREGFDTVLFGASVLSADVAAGLAARLDAGLNWDLVDLELRDGMLVGKRPALQDSVYVDVGWTGEPRLALIRSGTFEPVGERRRGGGRATFAVEIEDWSRRRRSWSSAPTRRARARRSRMPT